MNETIFRFFNDFALQNETFDTAVIFLSDKFGLILIFGLIIFLFYPRSHLSLRSEERPYYNIRNIAVIFISAFFAWLIASAIKFFYFSPRPFEVLNDTNVLFEHGGGDSFPSGHATFYSALAVSFYFYHKYLAWIYIIGALLIGLSRITAGIHWPADILAGYALGGVIGYLAYKLLAIR